MRLALHDLCSMHPKLRGDPTDYSRFGGLALQRAGHASPASAEVDHDGLKVKAEIEWPPQDLAVLEVLDRLRVTENGAEGVALAYANIKAGWVVKRRCNRGEYGDWVLRGQLGWVVLEISGTEEGDPFARLTEKKEQVGRCTLPCDRLAVVVAFDKPAIIAGRP